MMLRRILIGALLVAAVVILIRTLLGTPGMRRMVEGFQSPSAPSTLNTVTECPAGSQMYMYEGAAYCCNGMLNPDADDIQQTCKPLLSRNFELTFCTIGPPTSAVPNCMELLAGQMQVLGEELCPHTLPNYARGNSLSPTAGRCCQSLANSAFTDCMDICGANSFCDMTPNTNIFAVPGSCQFLRLKEDAATECPTGTSQSTINGQDPFSGMTLIGCSNGSTTCYPPSVLSALTAAGYTNTSLSPCAVEEPGSA